MRKGQTTRREILRTALSQASRIGLEGLSIGRLAKDVGMSKSGLFAHFGSKEGLQEAVLLLASDLFVERVIKPSLKAPRGLPRVEALFEAWIAWNDAPPVPGGCIFVSTSFELDDRPGPVRDVLVDKLGQLRSTFERAIVIAQEEGHLKPDVDPGQLAFEVHAIVLGHAVEDRLFRSGMAGERAQRAFTKLIQAVRA